MTLEIQKAKKTLNKVTHSVRAVQAVLQYGVGAMIDFPDQTLMTSAPEYWAEKVIKIHDERLEKALKVDYFGTPGGKDEVQFSEGISYVRFPEWYFCPKCRRFQPLNIWLAEYKRKVTHKTLEIDPYMIKNMQCKICNQDLVVARIITVCEDGHISDFPWIKWVHKRHTGGAREVCAHPSLTFKTGSSANEGLEGLVVTCETCQSKATLKDAFDPKIFEKLDAMSGKTEFLCEGKHPWKHTKESCYKYPKVLQRGASSVYFPFTLSSLVIPPYSDKLNKNIENSSAFQECIITIKKIPKEYRSEIIKSEIGKWAHDIAVEIGVKVELIEVVLKRKWIDQPEPENEYDTMGIKYRAEEYDALNGSIINGDLSPCDFVRESMDITEYPIPGLKNITLIHKMREVRALTGFTRISPSVIHNSELDSHFVCVKEPETNWYPAYEVRGEGIFIEFDECAIGKWLKNNKVLEKRCCGLNKRYNESFMGSQNARKITPKFILLHTLAHLLIKQLSFECGYNIASLRERLYCGDIDDGKEMAGIFIYTASGDSEGTLGGLVRQGRSDSFVRLFKKSLKGALVCSNDPVCILSHGQGRDDLNLAACHACALIPETSCEEYNLFLDRGAVIGTFENKEIGFYSEWVNEH
nr:DUF1998 domain-containing protein [uncultured Acetobacterium sp.]